MDPLKGDVFQFNTLQKADLALNDSDKSFGVPTSKCWRLLWAYVDYTATAVAGNRVVALRITDASANEVFYSSAGLDHAATLNYKYIFVPSLGRDVTNTLMVCSPLPNPCFLSVGQVIRIWDTAAIDAAADDMKVMLYIQEAQY